MNRRSFLLGLPCLAAIVPQAQAADGWSVLGPNGIVLFRHANAPGVGDPPNFVLGDCSTQRNLDERGRVQARAIGQAFRSRRIAVGRVVSSQWCRARETAELAFPGRVEEESCFNSFFDDRSAATQATQASLAILEGWRGPGVLVVVTHQVNISALTSTSPASGEGVVVGIGQEKLEVLGRIAPPR